MAFDVNAILSAPVGTLATKYENLPDGDYNNAYIDTGNVAEWFREVHRSDGTDALTLNIPITIKDPAKLAELQASHGLTRLATRMTIWLDTENGRVSTGPGKNVNLGQLRDVLGQNDDPDWNFQKLSGAGPFQVKNENTVSKKDGRSYANVNRVAKNNT